MKNNNHQDLMTWILVFSALSAGLYLFYLYLLQDQRRERNHIASSPGPINSNDLNLFAGFKWDQHSVPRDEARDRYKPVIAHNAISANGQYAQPFSRQFNVTRLPRTHIDRVLRGLYPDDYRSFGGGPVAAIETVLGEVEQNVCALSRGIGVPVATGVLIAPDLLLTPRHALEEMPMQELRLRFGYQLTVDGMDYGACFEVNGVVEAHPEFDYAIVQLSRPIPTFRPLSLSMTENYLGASMFVHHPRGEPKQVSVHATFESDYYQFNYSGFHDSYQGSSGGVYVNAEGQLVGMHLLNNGTTGARWMKTLWENSRCMQQLFGSDGEYLGENDLSVMPSKLMLSKTEFSRQYHNELERVNKPVNLPNLNAAGQLDLSYHHIIPVGDMEFLWVMGQEYPKLGGWLKDMAFEKSEDINAIAWAPWNLMIGPTDRSDDPHADDVKEARNPGNIPDKLWDALSRLHKAIEMAWEARYKLSESNDFRQYRTAQIGSFDKEHLAGASRDRNIDGLTFGAVKNLNNRKYKAYAICLGEVMKCVQTVKQVIPHRNFKHAHEYQESGWSYRHGEFRVN